MSRLIFVALLLVIQAPFAKGQLWLSPVNTGDCVADRITAKKTGFVKELDKKYCAKNLPDKVKERTCLKNTQAQEDFSFFTDRCSEGDYFIGINGEEIRLRKISKRAGKPHSFVGSFAGKGFGVDIGRPRLIKKTYFPGGPRNEDNVENAQYNVLVTVKRGARKESFEGILSYGL